MTAEATQRPLVVDLDGCLIKSDLLAETATGFLTKQPWRVFDLLAWLLQGKGVLKTRLAQAVRIDPTRLPYNEQLLGWLRQQKAGGRRLVLATASHRLLAEQVAAHLALFDEVLSTEGATNLKGPVKRNALVERFGDMGFDYVGNDAPDLAIWQCAAVAHVVSRDRRLIGQAQALGKLRCTFSDGRPALAAAMARTMRPHQWVKNVLIALPLLAAHRYGAAESVFQALVAFAAFCLTSSAGYLINDLADVSHDRHHPRKRHRPLAAGDLSLLHAWMMWPALLAAALVLAAAVLSWRFTGILVVYFALTLAYSLRLKRIPLVDVLALASLYTLRIVAGAAAIAVPLSFWLLAFSMFLFVSLAFLKRYGELLPMRSAQVASEMPGRGYMTQDLEMVSALGTSAGYIAVLILALYIQDSHTAALYAEPRFIWLACPALLFWISRAWLIAHRGQMLDDPVVFALTDPVSWLVIAFILAVFVLARFAG